MAHARAYWLVLLAAAGPFVAGAGKGETSFVPFVLPEAGGRWRFVDEVHLAYNATTGRLFTVGNVPGSWRVSYFDPAAPSFIAGATVSGRGSEFPLDLAADSDEILVAWGTLGVTSERKRATGLGRVRAADGVVLSDRPDLPFLTFDLDAQTRTLFGVAGPGSGAATYTLLAYDVPSGTTRAALAPWPVTDAIPRDVVVRPGGAEFYVLWVPTQAPANPDWVWSKGIVEAYSGTTLERRATLDLARGVFRAGALALDHVADRLFICPAFDATAITVIDTTTFAAAGEVAQAVFGPAFLLGGKVAVDSVRRLLFVSNRLTTEPRQAVAVYDLTEATSGDFLQAGELVSALACDERMHRLYTAAFYSQDLAVCDVDLRRTDAVVQYGARPVSLVTNAYGTFALTRGGGLLRMNSDLPRLEDRVLVGSGSTVGLVQDLALRRLYVGTRRAVPPLVLDLPTGEAIGALPVSASLLALDGVRQLLYAMPVPGNGPSQVAVLASDTLSLVRRFPAVPDSRLGLLLDVAVDERSGQLYALSGGSILEIDPDAETVRTVPRPAPLAGVSALAVDRHDGLLIVAGATESAGIAVAVLDLAAGQAVYATTVAVERVVSLVADDGEGLAYLLGSEQATDALILVAVDYRLEEQTSVPIAVSRVGGKVALAFDAQRNRFAISGEYPAGVHLVENPVSASRRRGPPEVPAAPTLQGRAEPHGVFLAWSAETLPGRSPPVGYQIERADTAGVFRLLRSVPLPVSWHAYFDAEAPAEIQRWYRVRAVDALGRSGEPSNVVAVTPEPLGERFFLEPLQGGVRVRPAETAAIDVLLHGAASYEPVALDTAEVTGPQADALSVEIVPTRVLVPGTARVNLAVSPAALAGRWHLLLRATGRGAALSAALWVDVVPQINGDPVLRNPRVPWRSSALFIASDATLSEQAGSRITVKGRIGLPAQAYHATALEYVVQWPGLPPQVYRGAVATGGLFARAFPVPEGAFGDASVQVVWHGTLSQPGGTSNRLIFPLAQEHRRSHLAQFSTNDDPVAVLVGGEPPPGKADTVREQLLSFREVLMRQRYSGPAQGLLVARSLGAVPAADGVASVSAVQGYVHSCRASRLLLLYLIGDSAIRSGQPYVRLEGGSGVGPDDLLQWIDAGQRSVIIVDAPHAGAFAEHFRAQGRTVQAVVSSCRAGQRAGNLPRFSRLLAFELGRGTALGPAFSMVSDFFNDSGMFEARNEPVAWNVTPAGAAHFATELRSQFVPAGEPLFDTLRPEISRIVAAGTAIAGRPLDLWLEAVDLPDTTAPLSARAEWWASDGTEDEVTLTFAGAGRYAAVIVPHSPGLLHVRLTVEDRVGNHREVTFSFVVQGTVAAYDGNGDRTVDRTDLVPLLSKHPGDWYTWFGFAQWWGMREDGQ